MVESDVLEDKDDYKYSDKGREDFEYSTKQEKSKEDMKLNCFGMDELDEYKEPDLK